MPQPSVEFFFTLFLYVYEFFSFLLKLFIFISDDVRDATEKMLGSHIFTCPEIPQPLYGWGPKPKLCKLCNRAQRNRNVNSLYLNLHYNVQSEKLVYVYLHLSVMMTQMSLINYWDHRTDTH